MRPALILPLVFAALALVGAGCGGMTFYDVTRAPVEVCDITPNGAFCDEEGAPVIEVFAVELRESQTVIYFGDEAWIAEGTRGAREVLKEERATRLPGPCTSTRRRHLVFDEDGQTLTGTLEESTVIEGPAACGETPRGERVIYALDGARTNRI